LPNNISSGDVVVIAGSFDALNLNFGCTVDAPCFLLGDPGNPPTALGESSLSGSYFVVEGVNFGLPNNGSGSTLAVGGTHGVVRNGSISGNNSSGGAYTQGQFLLIQNNFIHDNGDVNVSSDQDRHGLKVGGTDIWIIGNEFTRNSGDGVQVGGIGTQNSVQNIYIGGNTTYNNKQTGIWVKESRNVIISSNLAYNHSPSGSSDGEGIGGQYDSHYVWVIFNEIRDNTGGVGFKSSNNGGGTNFYVIGNYIHDNINNNYDPGYAGSRTAIASRNNADITIVNNTLDRNSGGINLLNTGGAYVYNNVITNMQHPDGIAINADNPNDLRYSDYNATDGDPIIDAGTEPYAVKNPYSIFQDQYGLSIMYDIEGKARPVGKWDIGAFESPNAGGPRPNPPTILVTD
jgi:parallel beta-helix repeat protein